MDDQIDVERLVFGEGSPVSISVDRIRQDIRWEYTQFWCQLQIGDHSFGAESRSDLGKADTVGPVRDQLTSFLAAPGARHWGAFAGVGPSADDVIGHYRYFSRDDAAGALPRAGMVGAALTGTR